MQYYYLISMFSSGIIFQSFLCSAYSIKFKLILFMLNITKNPYYLKIYKYPKYFRKLKNFFTQVNKIIGYYFVKYWRDTEQLIFFVVLLIHNNL